MLVVVWECVCGCSAGFLVNSVVALIFVFWFGLFGLVCGCFYVWCCIGCGVAIWIGFGVWFWLVLQIMALVYLLPIGLVWKLSTW